VVEAPEIAPVIAPSAAPPKVVPGILEPIAAPTTASCLGESATLDAKAPATVPEGIPTIGIPINPNASLPIPQPNRLIMATLEDTALSNPTLLPERISLITYFGETLGLFNGLMCSKEAVSCNEDLSRLAL
jgi:hypothetical protein